MYYYETQDADGVIIKQPITPYDTGEEAAIMIARVGKHGPWSAEERMEYMGR